AAGLGDEAGVRSDIEARRQRAQEQRRAGGAADVVALEVPVGGVGAGERDAVLGIRAGQDVVPDGQPVDRRGAVDGDGNAALYARSRADGFAVDDVAFHQEVLADWGRRRVADI